MNQPTLQTIVLDAHVHLYPCYHLDKALEALFMNLAQLGSNVAKVAFLAERFDCNYFEDLKNSRCPDLPDSIRVLPNTEKNLLRLYYENQDDELLLFAGRQIVTRERIEVLAVNWNHPVPNDLSARDVIHQVGAEGGIPIVSWSPGKWMFERGKVVSQLLTEFPPDSFALGDTTLRPIGWNTPKLMKKGIASGFTLTAGSDPLPFEGEEKRLGSYGSLTRSAFDMNAPLDSIRDLLLTSSRNSQLVGKRNPPLEMAQRLLKNSASKKKKSPMKRKHTTQFESEKAQIMTASESYCHIPPGTRVLVTGATGFTGAVVTRKLHDAGVKINAIARQSSNLEPLSDLEINWFRGDVADKELIRQATKDVDYIFHIAAAFRDAKSREADYHRIHVESSQNLVAQAMRLADFKRYVHISTIGVHGHIEDPGADENYRFSPGDLYQETKLVAEKWLQKFTAENDFPFTVIRPAAIYGPGDRRLLKLFKMAKQPVFPLLGKGKCYYHLIHVDDLSNAIILAATEPKALGETFIIGNPEPIPIAEIVQTVAKTLGRKTRAMRLPIAPFFLAADLCEAICRPFNIEPPIYRRRVAFYTKDRMFNTDKMREVLGYHTQHSNKDGIVQTTRWYLDSGWLKA